VHVKSWPLAVQAQLEAAIKELELRTAELKEAFLPKGQGIKTCYPQSCNAKRTIALS
jgi:hypothetical protein